MSDQLNNNNKIKLEPASASELKLIIASSKQVLLFVDQLLDADALARNISFLDSEK